MLKNIIWVFLFVLIGSVYVHAQKVEFSNLDSMKFKITIINNYFGRVNNRTIVTQDSLSYETLVYRGNSEKNIRLLSNSERLSLGTNQQ